ncbi:hypothetical protein HHK36_019223 [Tetracentron sinense]|uniref:Thaumatin-like protein n=1 Tax=Tetracentron sinense TaxID=13715 RepID=A0A834YX78_TETSI|nr:hypothetical protein HHK36_019223 [Tetracentron sinense]
MARLTLVATVLSLLFQLYLSGIGVFSASSTIHNKCRYTVWPVILRKAGTTVPLSTTGGSLQKGKSMIISAPASWSGRLRGRTNCSEDSTGKFSCVTGDCGSGECAGGGAKPPVVTLVKITLNGAGGYDFYGVSLVDGFNLPVQVVANAKGGTGGGNCTTTVDLNQNCPSELKVSSDNGGESVACKSACGAFGEPQYCCTGNFSSPSTCKPTSYSKFFKNACPRASTYAFDQKTSTFTCASPDYRITFCPSLAKR